MSTMLLPDTEERLRRLFVNGVIEVAEFEARIGRVLLGAPDWTPAEDEEDLVFGPDAVVAVRY